MKGKISRRDFIRKSGVGVGMAGIVTSKGLSIDSAKGLKGGIPKRKLGRTGRMVSCIGFGGGSRFCSWVPQERWAEKLIEYAIELGITYFDTSIRYGENMLSEKRFGKYLTPKYRDKIFLATKSGNRTYDEVMKDLEQSLKNLKTDYLDLYHMHGIVKEDVKKLAGPNGGYKAYRKLKDAGVIKNIGFSCHETWDTFFMEAMDRFNPDVVMAAINAARDNGVEQNFMPIASERNIGIVAMKVSAQNELIGKVSGQDLVRYDLSLPLSVVNVGMDGFSTLESCVRIAKESPISSKERDRINKQLAYDPAIHKLPYYQPGYTDGVSYC